MTSRSIRNRINESANIWPGFVDVLATLLMVIIFVLMVFTVSQIYLSDAISGRDKALDNLRNRINELSKILIFEKKEKESILDDLVKTESELENEQILKKQLENRILEGQSIISTQSVNISLLSEQLEELLNELKIVAKALETYEGLEITSLDTKGLGERINKALANRIDQLNQLNADLDLANKNLDETNKNLDIVNKDLDETNKNLDIVNKDLDETNKNLDIVNKDLDETNKNLLFSQEETKEQLNVVEKLNLRLSVNEEMLEDQIIQYQELTNDLIAINESLGLEDASLIEQLEAIKNKNLDLVNLNNDLIKKDATILDLRGKIFELNNILSLDSKTQLEQTTEIAKLTEKLKIVENKNLQEKEESKLSLEESEKKNSFALEQINVLSEEIDKLKYEISILNSALESNEQDILTKELKIEVLGERLNKALTSKVFELQKYRSEFFGKLQTILEDRQDIKVVGDRFIFQSELLFDSGSASLQSQGKEKLKEIALTLKEITMKIPNDIDWIIQVEGHTDKNPINTFQFPSNWELSIARANTVLKLLLQLGFEPTHLSAAGYGEFYPISMGNTVIDFQQNRRIELKLTSR